MKVSEMLPYFSVSESCGLGNYAYIAKGPNVYIPCESERKSKILVAALNAAYQLGFTEAILGEIVDVDPSLPT